MDCKMLCPNCDYVIELDWFCGARADVRCCKCNRWMLEAVEKPYLIMSDLQD